MTADDYRVGGPVEFPDDLRIPVRGARDPESFRAILGNQLRGLVVDDPVGVAFLLAWIIGGIALVCFLLAVLT